MALFEYLKQAQRFLREANQDLINPNDLISYCNRARREIAMRAMAIRILSPISGSVIGATVTNGGSGYTNPTVTITAPDFPSGMLPKPQGEQATAQAIVVGGVITSIDITYGGYGYWEPGITITDPTGSGATATPSLSYINQLNQGQEVYPFSQVDLSAYPGVGSVYWIRRCSVIFSNWRYSLRVYSFTTYNAQIRTFAAQQYQYAPFFAAQFGRGTGGSFFLYPPPSQPYQIEFDMQCLPADLIDDQSVEALPMPFTEAVPYFMAHLGYLELQDMNKAKVYLDLFDQFMHRYAQYTQPGQQIDPYNGRW